MLNAKPHSLKPKDWQKSCFRIWVLGFRAILGLYGHNGKEDGNYRTEIRYILGLYRGNGKNGRYCIIGYIAETGLVETYTWGLG